MLRKRKEFFKLQINPKFLCSKKQISKDDNGSENIPVNHYDDATKKTDIWFGWT